MRILFLLLVPASAAAVIAAILTAVTQNFARRFGLVDLPGPRKIHRHAVPRIGGVAIVFSVLLVLGAVRVLPAGFLPSLPDDLVLGLAGGVIPIFAVSLWDDVRSLGPAPRFAAQLIGVGIAIAFGIRLGDSIHLFGYTVPLGPLAVPLTVLWMVGITNAFNIIDGLDGLSAGLALISATSVAVLALVSANSNLALISLILVGALVGFLPYNTYPAHVFLGDCGATAVGFWLSCLALPGGSRLPAGMAVVVPLLAVGVPVTDTLLSVVRRLLRRLRRLGVGGVFEGDVEHIHHRLLKLGFNHPRAVLLLYGVALAAAAVGMLSLFVANGTAGILLATLFAAAFIGVARLGYDEFALIGRGVVLRFYEAPVLQFGFFRVFVDLALVALAFYGAIVLKYEDWALQAHRSTVVENLAFTLPAAVAVFWSFRMYKRSWRFAGIEDVVGAGLASVLSGAGAFVVSRLVLGPETSLTLYATYTMVLLVLVGSARSSFRVLHYFRERKLAAGGTRVAVYGAGPRGILAIRELNTNSSLNCQVVGFIDDDASKHGRRIAGYPVLGSVAALEVLILRHQLQGIVLASEKVARDNLARALDVCQSVDIDLHRFSLDIQTLRLSSASAPLAELQPGAVLGARLDPVSECSLPARTSLRTRFAAWGRIRRWTPRRSTASLAVHAQRPRVPVNAANIVQQKCPKCDAAMHRAHVRSLAERIRRSVTVRRRFRCDACGCRRWLIPLGYFDC